MDYESIGLELDSIIEEVKSKKIKLSDKDIQVIDEIISKLDEQKLRRKDEERNVELLNKLEEIVQVTSGNKVISEDSSQKIIEAIQNLKIETPIVNVAAPEVSVEMEQPLILLFLRTTRATRLPQLAITTITCPLVWPQVE